MLPQITPPQAVPAASNAGAEPPNAWRVWSASHWGDALLEYYFYTPTRGEPLLRLSVTADELTRVAQAASSDAAAVRAAFLAAIACTPDEFRAYLRPGRLTDGEWRGSGPPPFLPYLIFTCYAAATLDEVVAKEGDFRAPRYRVWVARLGRSKRRRPASR